MGSFTSTGMEGRREGCPISLLLLLPLTRVDRVITAVSHGLPTGLLATGVVTGRTGRRGAWPGRCSKAAYRTAARSVVFIVTA